MDIKKYLIIKLYNIPYIEYRANELNPTITLIYKLLNCIPKSLIIFPVSV